MLNTEREKIYILSLYRISVLDRGGVSYEIRYNNDKVYYNKINFRNLDSFSVINCIIRTFKLGNLILLKEKFLIENNITKYWINSSFIFVKNGIKIPYSYGSYKEQNYDVFVKKVNDIYTTKLKETNSNYTENDRIIIPQHKIDNNYITDDIKIKKETIKNILVDKNMLV